MKPITFPIRRFNLAGRVRRRIVRVDLGPCLEIVVRYRGTYHASRPTINGMVAARVIVALTNGRFSSWQMVCHHCDNPQCIRRVHLFVGFAADNNSDRTRKEHARNRIVPISPSITLPKGCVRDRMRRQIRHAIPFDFSARHRYLVNG